uniref:Uncharacterized protein n=1 Tax=Siphoviridae sp. ctmIh35 TaxID=2827932 RepID=A0A8S5T8W6_9CAUD|nr:MAG TPA: hypothetical protein [Siphoviridae sp. ctmIh35]
MNSPESLRITATKPAGVSSIVGQAERLMWSVSLAYT